MKAKTNDHTCIQAAFTIRLWRSMFTFDIKGTMVRITLIDGALQQYIPATLRPRILHLRHHFLLPGHLGKRRVYNTMRQHFYWRTWPALSTIQWSSADRAQGIAGLIKTDEVGTIPSGWACCFSPSTNRAPYPRRMSEVSTSP